MTCHAGNFSVKNLQVLVLESSDTAAPEPASLTLLGIGGPGLAGYRWRRRKKAVPS